MRPTRTLTILAGLAILALAAGPTSACPGSSTKVSGSFDASGHFVLSGAWDKDGAPVTNAKGVVLESFTTAENLVIPASSLSGKQVCLWGDLDVAHRTMSVAGYKECGPGACDAKSAAACISAKGATAQALSAPAAGGCCAASAKTAGAGSDHCGAKAASASAPAGCCAAGTASQASSAGASCGAKAATASSAGASCGSKAAAARSSCGAGAAKAASAGSCGGDAASAKASNMVKSPEAPKADAAVATYVYDVSGMTCGGCASKVEAAVTKLALPNVTGCTVDLEKHQATVTATGEIDGEVVQKAITAAGFPATPVTPETAKG